MNKRQALSAIRGDQNAAMAIARQMLQGKRETLDELKATIETQRREEWDAEARREECFAGEYDPEMAVNALSQLYQAVLEVTYLLPLALLADGQQRQQYENRLIDNAYDLAVMLANPTIRYAIVAGFDPEVRPEVDEKFQQIGRELWGTAYTLTDPGKIQWSDFPTDTAAILQDVAQRAQQQQSQQNRGGPHE